MKILTLGPDGSYSSEAARKFDKKAELFFEHTNEGVVEVFSKTKKYDFAVVPVENTNNGTVIEVLDAMYQYSPIIYGGLSLDIHHNLAAKTKTFKKIASHPQALGQCKSFLSKKYPNKLLESVSSTAFAAELAAKNPDYCAIVSLKAAENYKLKVLHKDIEDTKNNKTFFWVLSKKLNPKKQDHTAMVIKPDNNKIGVLLRLLMPFSYLEINLTRIESRPIKGKVGEYLFYINCNGDLRDKKLIELRKIFDSGDLIEEYKIFGSY